MGDLIGLVSVVMIFSVPIIAIMSSHRKEMLEMQMQNGGVNDTALRAELERLREEVKNLRDTTTQYDMSIDHTLQTLGNRVTALEVNNREANQPEIQQVISRSL